MSARSGLDGAVAPGAVLPELADLGCPAEDLLSQAFRFVWCHEQVSHRAAVVAMTVQRVARNLHVEPHDVSADVAVIDICFYALRVRDHLHIVVPTLKGHKGTPGRGFPAGFGGEALGAPVNDARSLGHTRQR